VCYPRPVSKKSNYKLYAYIVKHKYVLSGMLFAICKAHYMFRPYILQPEDDQYLWPKHVVVLYIYK
jgi:hypothetical protein